MRAGRVEVRPEPWALRQMFLICDCGWFEPPQSSVRVPALWCAGGYISSDRKFRWVGEVKQASARNSASTHKTFESKQRNWRWNPNLLKVIGVYISVSWLPLSTKRGRFALHNNNSCSAINLYGNQRLGENMIPARHFEVWASSPNVSACVFTVAVREASHWGETPFLYSSPLLQQLKIQHFR